MHLPPFHSAAAVLALAAAACTTNNYYSSRKGDPSSTAKAATVQGSVPAKGGLATATAVVALEAKKKGGDRRTLRAPLLGDGTFSLEVPIGARWTFVVVSETEPLGVLRAGQSGGTTFAFTEHGPSVAIALGEISFHGHFLDSRVSLLHFLDSDGDGSTDDDDEDDDDDGVLDVSDDDDDGDGVLDALEDLDSDDDGMPDILDDDDDDDGVLDVSDDDDDDDGVPDASTMMTTTTASPTRMTTTMTATAFSTYPTTMTTEMACATRSRGDEGNRRSTGVHSDPRIPVPRSLGHAHRGANARRQRPFSSMGHPPAQTSPSLCQRGWPSPLPRVHRQQLLRGGRCRPRRRLLTLGLGTKGGGIARRRDDGRCASSSPASDERFRCPDRRP